MRTIPKLHKIKRIGRTRLKITFGSQSSMEGDETIIFQPEQFSSLHLSGMWSSTGPCVIKGSSNNKQELELYFSGEDGLIVWESIEAILQTESEYE